MSSLSVTIANVEAVVADEARHTLAQIVARCITQGYVPVGGETNGQVALRTQLRGQFNMAFQAAALKEEQDTVAMAHAIKVGLGSVLDAFGVTLDVERTSEEKDVDYQVRLNAANDVALKPIRSALNTACETLIATLLADTAVSDIVAVVATDIGR